MAYSITLIPGDGIGPEVVAAAVRVLTATGLDFDWETEIAGASAIGSEGIGPAPPRARIDPEEQARPQGAHGDPGRDRPPLGERGAAQDPRPLRQPAPGADPARGQEPLRRGRPHRGAREHRGPLQRARARGGAGGGRVDQDHHREGLDAHRAVRLRSRPQEGPEAGDRRPQGQHHEALGRPLPRLLPAGGAGLIPRSPTTR